MLGDILFEKAIILQKKFFKMRLSVTERENSRKAVKNMISQMIKSELVAHFIKHGIARSTIYNTINRIQNGGPTKDNKLEKRSFQRRCWFG